MKIIILSASTKSSSTKSIIKAGEKRGHEMVVLNPAYLYLLVSDAVNGYDRIYDGFNKKDKPTRIKAKDIDAVISRIGNNLAYGCSVLQHFRDNLSIFTTQSPNGLITASDKLLSLQKISAKKIKVPKTVISDNGVHAEWSVEQIDGLPAVAKMLHGSQGIGVIPLESKLQTNAMLESFYKNKNKLLLQQYIDGDSKDIRAIVIDNKVITAMERTAPKDDIRANISLGGSGKKITLSKEDKDICVRSANACGLTVAGVDLMKDKNGKTYVIEVNGNYGYKIEEITGDDISTPLIEYVENNYKKPTNDSTNSENAKDEATNYLLDSLINSYADNPSVLNSIILCKGKITETQKLSKSEEGLEIINDFINGIKNNGVTYYFNTH